MRMIIRCLYIFIACFPLFVCNLLFDQNRWLLFKKLVKGKLSAMSIRNTYALNLIKRKLIESNARQFSL